MYTLRSSNCKAVRDAMLLTKPKYLAIYRFTSAIDGYGALRQLLTKCSLSRSRVFFSSSVRFTPSSILFHESLVNLPGRPDSRAEQIHADVGTYFHGGWRNPIAVFSSTIVLSCFIGAATKIRHLIAGI